MVLDRWRLEDVELTRAVGNFKFNDQWMRRHARLWGEGIGGLIQTLGILTGHHFLTGCNEYWVAHTAEPSGLTSHRRPPAIFAVYDQTPLRTHHLTQRPGGC